MTICQAVNKFQFASFQVITRFQRLVSVSSNTTPFHGCESAFSSRPTAASMDSSPTFKCAKILFDDEDDETSGTGANGPMEVEWTNEAFATPPGSPSATSAVPASISPSSPTKSHPAGDSSPCISRQAESFLFLHRAPKSPRALLRRSTKPRMPAGPGGAGSAPSGLGVGTPAGAGHVRKPNVNPFTPARVLNGPSPAKRYTKDTHGHLV